jgi:hypothetical protein
VAHAFAGFVGSNALPKKHSGETPLISSGVDHVSAWSVDIEPKIGDSQNVGARSVPPAQFAP